MTPRRMLRGIRYGKIHLVLMGVGIVALLLHLFHITTHFSSDAASFDLSSLPSTLEPIPHKIWQIYLNNSPLGDLPDFMLTWPIKNQDFTYTLLSDDGANAFARERYARHPEILSLFLDLKFPILRCDLLRYMLLESEGGIYSDLDTVALHPFSEWIPEHLRDDVRFVVGIEYDQGEGEPYYGMTEPLQFCQWTMASAPGHHVMRKVVDRVVQSLRTLAAKNHTTVAELNPSDDEVISVTGPLIWTDAIMDAIAETTATHISHKNFTGLKEPQLLGDILVLPVDGFATGQPHSGASRIEGYDPPAAMVRHLWRGNWKHGWSN